MHKVLRFISVLTSLLIFPSLVVSSQSKSSDYFEKGLIRYTNWTYDVNVRSIKLYKTGNELSEPVIELNSAESLSLSFDDLGGQMRSIWYSLIHCDALWQPSDIQINEYLTGYTELEIRQFTPSRNTLQEYIHYETTVPLEGMQITASGNYILKVYMKGEDDTLLFTRRLMVYEPTLSIAPEIRYATDLDSRNYYQEVRFAIDKGSFYMADPYQDLRMIIRQNGHWETAITTLKPRMIRGDLLEYDYDRGNYFSGGNEFRHVNIKSLKYYTESVSRLSRNAKGYHIELYPDERKTFKIYRYEPDINGRMLLVSDDATVPETESEYVWVRFLLPYEAPVFHGSIYIFGELSAWEYTPETRMEYDFDLKAYTCTMYLKQGYYDYQYVFLENGARQADEAFIEGRHSETLNEYYFMAYYRGPGDKYDRLIGYAAANSGIKN